MIFNYRLFLRQIGRSLFRTRNTHFRLTGTRIKFLVVFSLCFPAMVGLGLLALALDNILYRAYRRQPVNSPVFIIGNFRSGSTFLQRLLSKDEKNFTSMKTWEIYFAPSVIQRKAWRGFWALDKILGGRLMKTLLEAEEKQMSDISLHKIRLKEAEEDEAVFLYRWHSLFSWFFFPYIDTDFPYQYFDSAFPHCFRRKLMDFYKACVKRHLYSHRISGRASKEPAPQRADRHASGSLKKAPRPNSHSEKVRRGEKGIGSSAAAKSLHASAEAAGPEAARGPRFLSKNPSFSPKVLSLLEVFPDAKFVFLVRNPISSVPSVMRWFSFTWHYFGSPTEVFPHKDYVLDLAEHWYHYPTEIFKNLPEDQYLVIRFENLMRDPETEVKRIYEEFGIALSDNFSQILHDASKRQLRHYQLPDEKRKAKENEVQSDNENEDEFDDDEETYEKKDRDEAAVLMDEDKIQNRFKNVLDKYGYTAGNKF